MNERHQTFQSLYGKYSDGEFFEAEVGVRDALGKWPENAEMLQLGALTALELNQNVTAHQRIDRVIEMTPMTAEIANIRGRILKASGDWEAAERAYSLALKLNPKFERARLNRLNLFVISEQPKRVLEELHGHHDFGVVGDIAKAQALTELGRYIEALEVLENINEEAFQDRVLYQNLKCFSALGKLEDLRGAFSRLSFESPLYPKALSVVVNGYEMRGERLLAVDLLKTSVENPNPSISLQAVRLLRTLDEVDEANSNLTALFNMHPENIDILSDVAEATRKDGRADESCEIYKRALTLRPGDYGALLGYAQSAIVAGHFSEAQTVLQAALQQVPNNQLLLALVATLLREQGVSHTHLHNYDKFVRVYDLVPPKGYETISDFNLALKDKLDALHVYEKAPVNQSLRQGTQTEMDLSLIDDPVLRAFFDAIDAPIRDYMKTIGHDPSHPLLRRNSEAYRVQGAWSVRLQSHGHHVNHVHPMGWMSSAYYVDLPKNMSGNDKQGWIKFGEPNLNIDQPAEHYVEPKAGRLVLFPSYMWHGTVPFVGPDTRLTLPFDVVPA